MIGVSATRWNLFPVSVITPQEWLQHRIDLNQHYPHYISSLINLRKTRLLFFVFEVFTSTKHLFQPGSSVFSENGRTHLVNKCQRPILVRYITELFQRAHITCHGMNSLESNNLGCVRVCFLKQLFKVFHIIVPEDELLSATVPNALDHGCVVTSIGEYQTAWENI